jgi:hypothetical protein
MSAKIKHEDWEAMVADWPGPDNDKTRILAFVKDYVRTHRRPARAVEILDMLGRDEMPGALPRLVRSGRLNTVRRGHYIPGPNA